MCTRSSRAQPIARVIQCNLIAGSAGISFLSFSSGFLDYSLGRLHVRRHYTGPSTIVGNESWWRMPSKCGRAHRVPFLLVGGGVTMTFTSWVISRVCRHCLVTLCAIFLASLPAFSQANLGRILGAITDQSGGVVAGATVTILDVQRGISRSVTTQEAGEYNAPNLTPGTYTVRAESKGFKTAEHSGILLEVGKDVRVDLTPQPGEQAGKNYRHWRTADGRNHQCDSRRNAQQRDDQ